MAYYFDRADTPSLSRSNANDFRCRTNRLCRLENLPQAERQAQGDHHAPPKFPASPMLPSDLQDLVTMAMDYFDLPNSETDDRGTTSSAQNHNGYNSSRRLAQEQIFVKSSRHRQLWVDKVIANFQEKVCNMVGLGVDTCGDSNGSGQVETVTGESPALREEEESESEYTGGKRSASMVDLGDLLSSIRSLMSVLKKNEASKQVLQTKMELLHVKKAALHEEKKQYKRQRNFQRRDGQLALESVQV